MNRVEVDGIWVDAVDLPGALARVEGWLGEQNFRHVVAANASKTERTRRDPDLRAAVVAADLVLADGIGVLWRARRLGKRLPGRVPGVDLMSALLARAACLGWRVFFLGGRPGVAERAAVRARATWPGLVIVGVLSGQGTDDHAIGAVARSGADLLFVGMGTPRQELMLHRARERLGVRVAMGVGGSLDVLCGDLPRAPEALRRAGLEWAWRLVVEPRRLTQRRTFDSVRYVLR